MDYIVFALVASVKFLFVPITMALAYYPYWETIITTMLGGVTGVLFFFYFGRMAIDKVTELISKKPKEEKKKQVFSRTNKFIVKVKRRFGLIGLSIVTPCIISIPIGCLLAAKYYGKDSRTVPFLLAAVVLWSFVLTTFADFFAQLLNFA